MVEELLKFLIAEVNADLLEAIVIKNLKASNIQDTDERNPARDRRQL